MRIYCKKEGELVKIHDPMLVKESDYDGIIKEAMEYNLSPVALKNLIDVAKASICARTNHCYYVLVSQNDYAQVQYAKRGDFVDKQQDEGEFMHYLNLDSEIKEGVENFIKRLLCKHWIREMQYGLERFSERSLSQGIPKDYFDKLTIATYELAALHGE